MDILIITASLFLILMVLFVLGGLRETLGDHIVKILPRNHSQKGDQVDIFLNGKYNRTATISRISADKVYIYGSIGLPLDYRGRFYAVGFDVNDGSRLIYLGNRKHYRFVRVAEIIRKAFAVMDEVDNMKMAPVDTVDEIKDSQESEVSDDK